MFYKIIAGRDGEYCRGCQALPFEKDLVVDHRDNNNANNNLENLQLLCKKCNYIKNPRPVDKCVSVCKPRKTELSVNALKEPLFREYVNFRLNESPYVPEDDLIDSAAETLEISPMTANRYLRKMYSSAGEYDRFQTGNEFMVRRKMLVLR